MNKKIESNVKKILAIRNDHIGDLVLSSNIFEMLHKKYPNAIIDVIVSHENKDLILKNPYIRKIQVMKYSPRTPQDLVNYFRLSKILRRENYDLGVEIRGSLFNIFFFLYLARIKRKIGFYTNKLAARMLDYAHYKDYKGHATKNMVVMINKGLGTNFTEYWPKIFVSRADTFAAHNFFKKHKIKKAICLCIDASNESKQWPLKNFDSLIKILNKKYSSFTILLVGTDKSKMDFLIKRNPECLQMYKENLRFVFEVFKKSELVIGADGGPMHLAWVSKTRTLVLIPYYLKSYIEDIEPLGSKAHYIMKNIKEITTDEVVSVLPKIFKNV